MRIKRIIGMILIIIYVVITFTLMAASTSLVHAIIIFLGIIGVFSFAYLVGWLIT